MIYWTVAVLSSAVTNTIKPTSTETQRVCNGFDCHSCKDDKFQSKYFSYKEANFPKLKLLCESTYSFVSKFKPQITIRRKTPLKITLRVNHRCELDNMGRRVEQAAICFSNECRPRNEHIANKVCFPPTHPKFHSDRLRPILKPSLCSQSDNVRLMDANTICISMFVTSLGRRKQLEYQQQVSTLWSWF